jgi:hypothetical protein
MNERLKRQRLLDEGYTYDEVEDKLSDHASDAYDDEQDRRAEQHFKEKAEDSRDTMSHSA